MREEMRDERKETGLPSPVSPPPSKCKRCGECCKKITLPLSPDFCDMDTITWLNYHERVNVITLDNKYFVVIKVKCKYLKARNGKYLCAIHKNRPEICKDFNEKECVLSRRITEEVKDVKKG